MNDNTLLNFAVNQEKHVDKVFEKLVEPSSMTEKKNKSLKPVGSRPGVMYGSCKAHKQAFRIAWNLSGNCPPLPKFVGFEHSHLKTWVQF